LLVGCQTPEVAMKPEGACRGGLNEEQMSLILLGWHRRRITHSDTQPLLLAKIKTRTDPGKC
jgi:hypothetical protein